MLNRPTSLWSKELTADSGEWDMDQNPYIRFALLWIGMFLPLLAIGGRVAYLQLSLQDDFAQAFSLTTETKEDIPARDGRILTADGMVLATDDREYDIAVYFPVIQQPADDAWISFKAKGRLSKKEKRDREKLAIEKQKVLDENEQLWNKLATLTDHPIEEIQESRQKVQARIERIKTSVKRRFLERQAEKLEKPADVTKEPATPWKTAWTWIGQQLAEPPDRSEGPRQIQEEQDYHTIVSNVTEEMKDEIEAHPYRYPYTKIIVRTKRIYPQREMAAHVIGVRKPLTEEQLKQRREQFPDGDPQDYRLGDPYGVSGLEKTYDSRLKGVRGQRLLVKRRGEIIDTKVVRDAQPGQDLYLTLNADLQQQVERMLQDELAKTTGGTVDPETHHDGPGIISCPQGGCIVAIHVETGAIIAAASEPSFDNNLLVSSNRAEWDDLMADRRSPLISRITNYPLPPGSVFKPITAIAAVESGAMPPDEPFPCRGYLDRPDLPHRCLIFRHYHVGHGDVTLADALCQSCNVYFFTAARRMGPQTLVDWARQFGIGQPTGIDLPSESAGHLPAPDEPIPEGRRRPRWKPGETLGLAIGQSSLEVTPLQIARMMAAIANDGYLVKPHLAASAGPSTLDESNSKRGTLPDPVLHPIPGLHRSTLDYVRHGLVKVVHDPHGTGKRVKMKEITIAGKTGTAETNGVDHAWFAGYVPAEQPRIAFVVVLQNGGGGGKVAGPVAHDFVQALLETGYVTKSPQVVRDESRNRD